MKVLFITHHLRGDDGWSRYARDLAEAVQAEGAEVLCLVHELCSQSALPQLACLEGPLKYVANPVRSYISARRVTACVAEFRPDAIQFVVEPYSTMIPFLSTGGAKIILNAHSTFAFLPILVKGLKRRVSIHMTRAVYAKTDAVICISDYTRQHLMRHMVAIGAAQLIDQKIYILGGGINQRYLRISLGARKPHDRGEILFVGALKPRKGLMESIEALALVQSNYVYRIVGSYRDSDQYVKSLKQRIDALGLSDRIVVEGRVSESRLQSLYQQADLFLMLSTNNGADFEGYGLVYLEANAYGVPCIGPNDSGVSDAIVDGKTGYIVDQYNPSSVAAMIDHVLQHQPISAAECRAWASANSIDKKAKIMMQLYQRQS